MSDLIYYASYAFNIKIPNCKVGKEGVHQLLMDIVKRHGDNYLSNRWGGWFNSDKGLICRYVGEPFGNLRFDECVTITGDTISYRYVENTDQQVLLPNILSFIYMLLFALKTAEQLQDGFENHSVKCEVKVENNGNVYFYEKYNPLAVDYLFLLKYTISSNVCYEIELKSHNDVYLLVNRFYNQYKTDSSVAKPYITLVRDSFEQFYDAF